MKEMRRAPKLLGALIMVAIVVVAVSGIMLAKSASASDLEGEIAGLTTDNTGSVTSIVIAGQTITVNSDTKIEGTPLEGGVIKVKYVENDGNLVAREIEVEDAADIDEDNDHDSQDEDTHEDIDDDEEIELKGAIEELITDGDTVSGIVVDGKTVLINEDTDIEGTLEIDTVVEVEYMVDGDGNLIAREIEVEDAADIDEGHDNDVGHEYDDEGLGHDADHYDEGDD